MAERKAISKKLRFEVLKRDAFTCQYCGKQPPDTVLHIDHIKPVSKGGKNSLLNLVTSCIDCNLGKSATELSDDSAVKRQQKQIVDLAEKKAQIEMMIEWRESLLHADELLTDSAVSLIDSYMRTHSLNETGISKVKKAIKKKGYQTVIDAIEKCYCNSFDHDDFRSKWSKAIEYAGAKPKPSISYAKGILRNRGVTINDKYFYHEFNSAPLSDDQVLAIIEKAKYCNSMNDFRNAFDEVVNG